jgi:hypothetical protein
VRNPAIASRAAGRSAGSFQRFTSIVPGTRDASGRGGFDRGGSDPGAPMGDGRSTARASAVRTGCDVWARPGGGLRAEQHDHDDAQRQRDQAEGADASGEGGPVPAAPGGGRGPPGRLGVGRDLLWPMPGGGGPPGLRTAELRGVPWLQAQLSGHGRCIGVGEGALRERWPHSRLPEARPGVPHIVTTSADPARPVHARLLAPTRDRDRLAARWGAGPGRPPRAVNGLPLGHCTHSPTGVRIARADGGGGVGGG